MPQNQKPLIDLTEHIGNVIFEKKEDVSTPKIFTLEEQMVNYSNEVLGIKVMSVALPENFNPNPKSETELLDWLQNKIHHRHTPAYRISLKYGEKLKVKLEKKEPYIN